MVIIEQLRISDDGKRMYINVHVNNASYFDSRYITSIVIKTASQVSESDISPVSPSGENVYTANYEGNLRRLDLVLQPSDFNLNFAKSDFTSDLFFVYFICGETLPDECTPCALADLTTLGVTFDENILYQKVMGFTKSLADNCNVPVGFTDFILLWNAFKASVETEHYIPAIKYYNMLFDNIGNTKISRGCGCNG